MDGSYLVSDRKLTNGCRKVLFDEDLFDDDLESATDERHRLTDLEQQIVENACPLASAPSVPVEPLGYSRCGRHLLT